MAKPLSGKRYFHAYGMALRNKWGLTLATSLGLSGMKSAPLWACNAFVDGHMGVQLRRRPAHTERSPQ